MKRYIQYQQHIKELRKEKYKIPREYCSTAESVRIRDWSLPHYIVYIHNKLNKNPFHKNVMREIYEREFDTVINPILRARII